MPVIMPVPVILCKALHCNLETVVPQIKRYSNSKAIKLALILTLSTMSLKPQNATTGLLGFFNRRRDKYDSIIDIRLATSSFPLCDLNETASDDDTSSVSSHSTNSTVDDNPGPGRLIDKHLYQKLGKKLEHVIFWIRPPTPSPAQLSGFFEKIHSHSYGIRTTYTELGMTWCVNNILKSEHGKSSIYALKCLVKQTQ